MVVVVSPTTLSEPPALDAATMAARYPIWTFPRNTVCAIAPPIGAAAMLSRKDDSTNTITSSTNAPFQSRGRNLGSSAGTLLSSKCFDSSAKPSSRHRRLARMTHSWGRWASRPAMPSPALNPVKASLYRVMTASPTSATPSSVSANRMKSSGTPSTAGAAACIPYPFAVEEHLPTRTKVSLAKLGLPAGRRPDAGADPVLTTDRNGAPAAPP